MAKKAKKSQKVTKDTKAKSTKSTKKDLGVALEIEQEPLEKVNEVKDFGTIGPKKMKILSLTKVELNGRVVNRVVTSEASYLLNDEDLKNQVNK